MEEGKPLTTSPRRAADEAAKGVRQDRWRGRSAFKLREEGEDERDAHDEHEWETRSVGCNHSRRRDEAARTRLRSVVDEES